MTLMEAPIVEFVIGSPYSPRQEPGPQLDVDEMRSRLTEMLGLSHGDWMQRLVTDGFTETDIGRLDELVASLLNELELAGLLAAILGEVGDLDDEAELKIGLVKWLSQAQWETIARQIRPEDFPDRFSVLAHATRHLWHLADSTIWLESARRKASNEPKIDYRLDEEQIEEGIAMAEAGLAEVAREWPTY